MKIRRSQIQTSSLFLLMIALSVTGAEAGQINKKIARRGIMQIGTTLAVSRTMAQAMPTSPSPEDIAKLKAVAIQKASMINRSPNRKLFLEKGGLKARNTGALSPAASTQVLGAASSAPAIAQTFNGVNAFESILSNYGIVGSGMEPPDQGLAVGNGYVFEAVNMAVRIYDTNGIPLSGVIPFYSFFGYAPDYDYTTKAYGPSLFDPICWYDSKRGIWFFALALIGQNTTTGISDGTASIELAVSQTSNPLGNWNLYSIPTQNDGSVVGFPNHAGCPCFGDYPHMGIDTYGLYVTTNEFSITGPAYNGAQIYSLSADDLAAGNDAGLSITENVQNPDGTPASTIWPASAQPGQFATKNNGTEFFMSSTADFGNDGTLFDNRIVVWAMTNTASLNATPNPALSSSVVTVTPYSIPPYAEQKAGDIPLGTYHNATSVGYIDSNDGRMQQVWYAGGKLYSALDTIVTVGGEQRAGIAWYILTPTISKTGDVTAKITKQGQFGVAGNDVVYPAVAMLSTGKGIMTFTLTGQDYWPSAAYVSMGSSGPTATINASFALGQGPSDGFSEYGDRPRWGDYGAATVDGKSVWFASEYIGQSCSYDTWSIDPSCGLTRATYSNWFTRISSVTP